MIYVLLIIAIVMYGAGLVHARKFRMMSEWSKIKCKACGWKGTEEALTYGIPGCPNCGSVEDLVYVSDGAPVPDEAQGL